jgi:hypothetical protein
MKSSISPANSTTQPQPSYFGIIHAFRFHYRMELISKIAAMISGGPLQDCSQMKLDVLSAMPLIANLGD